MTFVSPLLLADHDGGSRLADHDRIRSVGVVVPDDRAAHHLAHIGRAVAAHHDRRHASANDRNAPDRRDGEVMRTRGLTRP